MTAPTPNPSTVTTETSPPTGPADQAVQENRPPTGQPADETDGAERTAPADERDDELPEWVRKRLSKANAEAANYRTRLREAETRLEGAKTTKEFEAALAEFKARNAELEQEILRAQVARRFHLPDELAARLRGQTAEELEADAQTLRQYATTPQPERLSGGLDPSDDGEVFDPVKEARRARAARR